MDLAAKHGVKRKREPFLQRGSSASKFRAKLHHGIKEVKKATKIAKVHETRRLVKRLKVARKNGDDAAIGSLSAQLECLKHIDLDNIAARALLSKINKDASLSENTDCQEATSSELQAPKSNPNSVSPERVLIESRMLSSKVLSAEVKDVIASLKATLGVSGQETLETGEEGDSRGEKADSLKRGRIDRAEASRNANGDDEEIAGDNFSQAGLDTSDSHTEHSDSDELEEQAEDDQSSSSDDIHRKTSQSNSPGKALRTNVTLTKKSAKAGESTFLPSLAVGFISGSDDSDWSDGEAKVADLPVKKNRRGQRARKAIWEKKYGKNANHLRKQRENGVQDPDRTVQSSGVRRGRGSSMSRGSVVRGRGRPISQVTLVSSPHTKASEVNHERNERTQRKSNAATAQADSVGKATSNVRPQKHSSGEDGKPLHPSWEAKRKLKEKESPAIVPSTGTRIKFT